MGSARLLSLLLPLLLCALAVEAVTFNCTFDTSCAGSEVGLLRAENDSGGYNNAHAELMNYSGSYAYTLCCDTDVNHTLSYDCTNENATIVLKSASNTNTHVQRPSLATYTYDICMALSPGNLTCEYINTTCTAGYAPVLSMASSDGSNETNAHIANYSYYTLNLCCKGGNYPPTVPTLLYPTEGNNSVFERNITFDWTDSTDPDGDPITYNFSLTQATCANDPQTGLGTSTYASGKLCVDKVYWWKVQACDATACSAWTASWNFTIASVIGLTFDVNNTNFGSMARGVADNTTDNDPPPFLVNNTGNVNLNVTIKADSSLFTSVGLGTTAWQYKGREYESGAYESTVGWTNMGASLTSLFTNLHYQESHDAASIDILVDLPYEEEAGYKSSVVNITGDYSG